MVHLLITQFNEVLNLRPGRHDFGDQKVSKPFDQFPAEDPYIKSLIDQLTHQGHGFRSLMCENGIDHLAYQFLGYRADQNFQIFLQALFGIFSRTEDSLRGSSHPRFVLEAAAVKAALLDPELTPAAEPALKVMKTAGTIAAASVAEPAQAQGRLPTVKSQPMSKTGAESVPAMAS